MKKRKWTKLQLDATMVCGSGKYLYIPRTDETVEVMRRLKGGVLYVRYAFKGQVSKKADKLTNRITKVNARLSPFVKLMKAMKKKPMEGPNIKWCEDELRPAFNKVLKGIRHGKTITLSIPLKARARFKNRVIVGSIYTNPRTGELYRMNPIGKAGYCSVVWLAQIRHPGIKRSDEPLEIGAAYAVE